MLSTVIVAAATAEGPEVTEALIEDVESAIAEGIVDRGSVSRLLATLETRLAAAAEPLKAAAP